MIFDKTCEVKNDPDRELRKVVTEAMSCSSGPAIGGAGAMIRRARGVPVLRTTLLILV